MIGTLMVAAISIGGFWPTTAHQGPDYHFTRALRPGQVLGVSNIDGTVTIRRASGNTAEVSVTKVVKRGNGDLVQAIMETTNDGIKVCTVYLSRPDEKRTSCDHQGNNGRRNEPLSVEMTYEVRLPSGVRLRAATVDGDINASGVDTPANITTVDGDVSYEGVMPEHLATVDGDVSLDVGSDFESSSSIATVDGNITIKLPAAARFEVRANTVDGKLSNDFGIPVNGKWGIHRMEGSVNGGGPTLKLRTVDGDISLSKR